MNVGSKKTASPFAFAFIRDKVSLGRSYLKDNCHATVIKQPAHRPFAFSRKPFRPWSKALSTQVKNLFD
ncbi:hypothetical protein EAJ15_14675 [Parabacteroides merdae]|nr:hypothetical protein EAJ15_14675 [Parabacteroides merdae]